MPTLNAIIKMAMIVPYAIRFDLECDSDVMKSSILELKNCRKAKERMYASTIPIA